MHFVFKCLNKYSSIASILFKYIDFEAVEDECISLIEENQDKINFQYLPNDIIREIINKIKKMKESINSLKNKNEKLKFFEPYNGIYTVLQCNENTKLNGILKYLTKNAEGNLHEKGVVDISTNSPSNHDINGHHAKNLVNFEDNSYFHSMATEYVNICFDFKDKSIQLNSYQIRTLNSKLNYHLKDWIIECSNDGQNWITIDEHKDDSILNESDKIVTFDKLTNKSDSFYRFIKLTQIGRNWKNDYYVIFHNIEFYGALKEPVT